MTSGSPQPFQSLNVVKTPQTDVGKTLEPSNKDNLDTHETCAHSYGLWNTIKTPNETILNRRNLFKDSLNFLHDFVIKLSFFDWIFLSDLFFVCLFVCFFQCFFVQHASNQSTFICVSLWVCEPVVWGDNSKNVWHHSAESYKSVSPPQAHRYWPVLTWDRTDTSNSLKKEKQKTFRTSSER